MTKLLEGIVDTAKDDLLQEVQELRVENAKLKSNIKEGWEILNAKDAEIEQLKRVLSKLRRQLAPLYQALQLVFGEIETIPLGDIRESSIEAGATHHAPTPVKSAIWDAWKAKLGGKKADVIDALLQHGELSVEQLCVITHTPRKQTIYDTMNALKKLQLTDGDGSGRYRLKQI